MKEELFNEIIEVYSVENTVYDKSLTLFNMLFSQAELFKKNYESYMLNKNYTSEHNVSAIKEKNLIIDLFKRNGDNEFELTIGSDMFVFILHTNIFEFPRNHEVMATHYVQKDKRRAQCGQILIYNFLKDSISLGRSLDLGYLIGRIFVNFESHVYIEGKREIGMLLNHFETQKYDDEFAKNILESAIKYVIHFGILVPEYDLVKEISVEQFFQIRDSMKITTSKRMGFTFSKDALIS